MIHGSRSRLFYPVVLLVFFMSGSAALIYQVAWQRVLTLYYGVGAVSVAVVVAVFMAGLGIGSVLGGWWCERTKRRVTLYIASEIAIAAFGVMSLPLFARALPLLSDLGYASGFLLIAGLLLLPTTLMGMTLPIMVKIVNGAVHDVGRNVSLLYFANTIGAAVGAFVASYWLVSFHGLEGAVWFAVGINLVLCVVMGGLARLAPPAEDNGAAAVSPAVIEAPWARERWLMFGSGLLAIGYQLVWFRVLSTLLKPNSYVFSTVLSVYLMGIALGSLWMSRKIRSVSAPAARARLFYVLNAMIALVSLLTFAGFNAVARLGPVAALVRKTFDNELHPPYERIFFIPRGGLSEIASFVLNTWDIAWWPMLIVLPCTLLMGASFPLITAAAIGQSQRDGLRTGLIACVAIAGNVAGALLTGFVLLPMIGTERTLLVFISLGLLWILGITEWRGRPVSAPMRAAVVIVLIVAAALVMPGPTALYAAMHPPAGDRHQVITEDVDGTAVTYRAPRASGGETIQVYIGGSSHATFPSPAYENEVLETATYARRVENVLIIGFGGGDLTNRILKTPGVGRVTVVEISKALADNIRQIPAYQQLLSDPRVRFVLEDGRRFLDRSAEQFDVLLMDPLQSTAAYSNNLYSLEFFQLVRARLRPEGLAMVWFNEYYVIPKTLATAFPHLKCFYFFCLASSAPMERNEGRRAEVWAGIAPDMREGIEYRLKQTFYDKGGRDEALAAATIYPVNRDLEPVTEYYVGYVVKTLRRRF